MKTCQLCGGTISGDRCTWCGMPVRDEHRLYHLNEDRSDHYVHSTKKIKNIMRQQETPLPDLRSGKLTSSARTQLDTPKPAPNVSKTTSRPNYTRNQTVPNVPGGRKNSKKTGSSFLSLIVIAILYAIISLIGSRG